MISMAYLFHHRPSMGTMTGRVSMRSQHEWMPLVLVFCPSVRSQRETSCYSVRPVLTGCWWHRHASGSTSHVSHQQSTCICRSKGGKDGLQS